MAGIDLRTYVLLERSFVRRLQRSWQQKSAPTYEAIAKACTDHQWDEARRLVQDLDLTEVGTENREWITYMLLSCAVFGANIVAKKAPSFVGVGSFDTFLKQTVNNFLQYLEYSGTSQVQAEALQSIAEDEAKTKAIKFDSSEPRDDKGKWTRGQQHPLVQRFLERAQGQHRVEHEDYQPVHITTTPNKTRFVLPDGTRISPASPRMEHSDVAFEALSYEGHAENSALTKLMEAGVVRYNRGFGGIQLIGPITEAQAKLVADDWNIVYNQTLYADSVQLKNGKADFEGSRSRQFEPPFTADALRHWINHPEMEVGVGGITKKFDAAAHPRGDDGRFVEATIPRIFNRPAELEMRKGWPGEPVRWSWKDPVTGEGTGRLLTGEPIAPEDMRATLYHVTTNAPAVESSGVLLGLLESGGLGGGQAPGVSFTSSKEDARVIQRELIRAVRVARGEVDENVFDQWAREDEKEAGLPQGSLQRAANYALEQSYRPNEFTLDKSFVWDDKLPDDKRGWVGPPHPPEERERLRRGLMKDALNAYLQLRPDAAAKAAGAEVPLLKNPILFGRQEHLAKLKPENVQILEVPSHLIPEGALVTTGSDKFLHEVRAYSDVPLPKKLQSIAKFDSTEPRDDKGRWEKVPGESLDAQDKGLVTERLKKLVSGEVYIGDAGGTSSRLTARVGSQVADVLEEMKAKGYTLPEDVAVYVTDERTPSGLTTEYVADEDTPRHSKGSSWRSLTIDMPRELPPYADLDKAARLVFAKNEGEYAVHSMKDIIIHEMGHVQAQKQESLDAFLIDNPDYTTERVKGAMERVSRYAMRNPDEFVAEAFTRMYRGEKLHPESMKLYKIWHGPEIRS